MEGAGWVFLSLAVVASAYPNNLIKIDIIIPCLLTRPASVSSPDAAA